MFYIWRRIGATVLKNIYISPKSDFNLKILKDSVDPENKLQKISYKK